VALTFAGTVKFEELDAAAHKARVRAQGTDAKGRGGAHATAAFRLEPSPAGSKVLVHTDLNLSGAVAQYARRVGMIQSTAAQLMKQSRGARRPQSSGGAPVGARRAAAPMAPAPAAPPPPPQAVPPPAGKPISGFSLMMKVMWDAIVRLFTGRSSDG